MLLNAYLKRKGTSAMRNKKTLQLKKAMKRLSKATEYVIYSHDEDGCTYQTVISPRRVLPGAEMRKFVHG